MKDWGLHGCLTQPKRLSLQITHDSRLSWPAECEHGSLKYMKYIKTVLLGRQGGLALNSNRENFSQNKRCSALLMEYVANFLGDCLEFFHNMSAALTSYFL